MNKKLLMFGLPILFLSVLVMAAVYYHAVAVDVQVNEAFESSTMSLSISMYPGETENRTIEINNLASVSLNTELSWAEIENNNSVDYTTDMPKTVVIEPGLNNVTIEFSIAEDSEIGVFTGNITLNRV